MNGAIANNGSSVFVSGDRVTGATVDFIDARNGSVIEVSGGLIGEISAEPQVMVNILGGGYRGSLRGSPGTAFSITGGEFRLNGSPVSSSVTLPAVGFNAPARTLTGVFVDGSPFVFSSRFGDIIGQVTLVPAGLSPADPTPVVVEAGFGPVGLRDGQTLTLRDGGALPEAFAAIGGDLRIEGGTVGAGLELVDTRAEITGGEVAGLAAYSGARVEIGGDATLGFIASAIGSQINIAEEATIEDVNIVRGGCVRQFGGAVSGFVTTGPDSFFYAFGGTFGTLINISRDSTVNLYGAEFQLNGQAVTSLSGLSDIEDVVTGTLEDGSPFIIARRVDSGLFPNGPIGLVSRAVPAVDTTPILVDTGTGPNGLRPGQTLTLRDGGELPQNFAAVQAELNLEGGSVGDGLEVADAVVKVSGGTIGDDFSVYLSSEVFITGGSIGEGLAVHAGSQATIAGGTVGDGFSARPDSETVISDGEMLGRVFALERSGIKITGGTLSGPLTVLAQGRVEISGGAFTELYADDAAEVALFGSEFKLDGVPITGLPLNEAFEIAQRDVLLTGTLADGSVFELDLSLPVNPGRGGGSSSPGIDGQALITVTRVPEPTGLFVGLSAVMFTRRRI